jgi:hypothetical protein
MELYFFHSLNKFRKANVSSNWKIYWIAVWKLFLCNKSLS